MNLAEYQSAVAGLPYGKRLPTAIYVFHDWTAPDTDLGPILDALFARIREHLTIGNEYNVLKFGTEEFKTWRSPKSRPHYRFTMNLTYSDFLKTAQENAGEVLVTSGGRATFQLEPYTHGVCFTPLSTGKRRSLNQRDIQNYLDIFNRTQSTNTSDYTERMRNPSYVLAIIKLCIGQHRDAPLIDDTLSGSEPVDPQSSAEEGNPKIRSHRVRERNRELVHLAKALFRQKNDGRIFCQVCGFDFAQVYGESDFIEVHHTVPLRDLLPGSVTKISDLAMVCANCHRMLHCGKPWPTIERLKAKIETLKISRPF